MIRGDERENRLHLESSRNGFIAYTFVTVSFWLYKLIQTEEAPLNLYFTAFSPFFIFVISVIYYHQKGLENGLSLSSLRTD